MIDASAGTPEIRLTDLTKHFRDVRAVDRVSLDIRPGEFFSMLGPSGCGKTTTLRMIGGFELPTAGRIELRGRDVTMRPARQAAGQHGLPELRPVPPSRRRRATSRSGSAGRASTRPRRSGASARPSTSSTSPATTSASRTSCPAASSSGSPSPGRSSTGPNVLLLDEPLGALDLKLRKALQVELKRVQIEVGITFVYVTHDQEEALTMSDRIAVMHGGRVEQLGTPEELYERPADAVRRRLHRHVEPAVRDGRVDRRRDRGRPARVGRPRAGSAAGDRAVGEAVDAQPPARVDPDRAAERDGRARPLDWLAGDRRAGRLSRVGRPVPRPDAGRPDRSRCSRERAGITLRAAATTSSSHGRRRGARPRRAPPIARRSGHDRRTAADAPTDAPIERELDRYLAERRITRRQLLEAVTALGAAVALAPIVAACTQRGPTPSAAAVDRRRPSPPPSTAPSERRRRQRHARADARPEPGGRALRLQLGRLHRRRHGREVPRTRPGSRSTTTSSPTPTRQLAKLRSDGKGGGYDVSYPTSTDVPVPGHRRRRPAARPRA